MRRYETLAEGRQRATTGDSEVRVKRTTIGVLLHLEEVTGVFIPWGNGAAQVGAVPAGGTISSGRTRWEAVVFSIKKTPDSGRVDTPPIGCTMCQSSTYT